MLWFYDHFMLFEIIENPKKLFFVNIGYIYQYLPYLKLKLRSLKSNSFKIRVTITLLHVNISNISFLKSYYFFLNHDKMAWFSILPISLISVLIEDSWMLISALHSVCCIMLFWLKTEENPVSYWHIVKKKRSILVIFSDNCEYSSLILYLKLDNC